MKKTLPKKLPIFLAVLLVMLLACVYLGRYMLADNPFRGYRVFDGPSGVFAGASGRLYIIDNGKKSVLIVNENGELERAINRTDNGFYYASLVAEGADGSIYVADAQYAGVGTALRAERIFRYDSQGTYPQLIYEIDYSDNDNPPLQYGRITSLQELDGELVFALTTPAGAEVHRLDLASGETLATAYALPDIYISDIGVRPDTLLPVFATRLGQVGTVNEAGDIELLVAAEAGRIPWRVCADEQYVYYTDLAGNQVVRLDPATGDEACVIQGEDTLYTVFVGGGRLYSTDYIGYYTAAQGEITYSGELPLAQKGLRIALWLALGLAIIIVLVLIILLLPLLRKKRSATFERMLIVITVSLCVGVLVSYIILSQMVTSQNEAIMEQLGLFGDLLTETVDVEALVNIQQIADYQGEDYNKVKTALDKLTRMTYDNELYYYYAIYATDGQNIYGVMDYEDTITAHHPFFIFGEEGYTDVFYSQTVMVSADVSSYGSWSFVLKPISDARGQVAAVLEVGANLDDLTAQNRALIIQIVLTVAAATVVLLMAIIELILLIENVERRRADKQFPEFQDRGYFPLRTLAFIIFLADCMQDVFVSVYSTQLYEPFWGIPLSVGAALPLSAQVLAAALFALFGGSLIHKAGIKQTLMLGFLSQLAGFLICGITANYWGLLIGKAFIGAGMGFSIVCINSRAASMQTEEASASAFAVISAGTLAGITAGAGVGSIVLSFATFSMVYYVGAFILLLGFLLALSCVSNQEPERSDAAAKVSMLKFLADKQVFTFLVFLLMPFLIALSFREYFFPIYAVEMGISEADIGRIYLVCGLVVIYAGPYLTKFLLDRLGSKWTVIVASAVMCAATLLFVLIPTLPAAIVSLLLLSVVISFGYTAQSTYYSGQPTISKYGKSKAMGVYSLFDSGGQTLGPILYGLVMLMGYRSGLFIIGISLAALIVLFILMNGKNNKGEQDVDI